MDLFVLEVEGVAMADVIEARREVYTIHYEGRGDVHVTLERDPDPSPDDRERSS